MKLGTITIHLFSLQEHDEGTLMFVGPNSICIGILNLESSIISIPVPVAHHAEAKTV